MPLRPRFFRYSSQKYITSFLEEGILRVGTLYDFRNSEHKKGIADPQEGKKVVTKFVDHAHITGPDDPNARLLVQMGIINEGGITPGSDIKVSSSYFANNIQNQDCFILCMARKKARRTMAQFEGADACIEIIDLALFLNLVTEALHKAVPVKLSAVGHVVYQDRREQWNGRNMGQHPAFIKEPEFCRQFESRCIWTPEQDAPIQPQIIKVTDPRLRTICRQIAL